MATGRVTVSVEDILRLARGTSTPSKRANKNRSGRQMRKTANGQKTLQRAGGSMNLTDLMLDTTAYRELCHTVPAKTGYVDGRPFRSPSGHRSSGAQRGA